MSKKFYEDINLKGNEVTDVASMQLQGDAAADDHAVRKLQAENIAALAVQAKIVSTSAEAASDNAYSADFAKAQLATKQPTMAIDASSTSFLEIVDGYKIKLKDLGINSTHKADENSLASFIANSTFNGNGTLDHDGETLDGMTFIFMESATLPAERSVIYLGTNNGNADDFVAFGVDYNSQEIRTFFSGTGTGLNYDVGTGQYSLVYGNGAGSIGAHTIPVASSEFSTVSGSTVLAILKALETLIAGQSSSQASATETVDGRCTSLLGTSSSSDMGEFTGSTLDAGKNLKELMQQVEDLIEQAASDRAAVAAAAAAATGVVQSDLTAEANARIAGDAALANDITAESWARSAADNVNSVAIGSESSRALAAEAALDARLDIVEGSGSGSIAKAELDAVATANAFALNLNTIETARAIAAEAALDLKVDNLQEGDIKFIGTIGAGGVVGMRAAQIAVESPTSRNGLAFDGVYFNAGEVFVVTVDQTMTFDDGTTRTLLLGDRVMALEDRNAGSATADDFNIVVADANAITFLNAQDKIQLGAVDGQGVAQLVIQDDAVGRDELENSVVAELDDMRSLTSSNVMSSPSDTHFVVSTDLDAQQNVYWKRTQSGDGPLTGTVRATLAELHVNSNGSGNPLSPSAAHVTTHAVHYQGGCVDNSLLIAGGNFEANAKENTAVVATGLYAVSEKPQNGVNIGMTATADGSTFANIGMVGFSSSEATGTHRGVVAAVSSHNVETYNGIRSADPYPHSRAALVVDAKYAPAGTKGIYAYGDCHVEGGKFEIEDAPASDKCPVRLGDVKALEAIYEFNLSDGVQKAISCGLDLGKSMISVVHSGDDVEVTVIRDGDNSQLLVTANGSNLVACRILVRELSCDVTSV